MKIAPATWRLADNLVSGYAYLGFAALVMLLLVPLYVQVLGVTFSQRGAARNSPEDFERAAGHLQQALETKPDDSRSLFNLGNIMLRFGRYDEAIALYRRALAKFPKHPRIHNNLGVALAQTGDLDAAEASFRRALALLPNMPEAVQGLQGVAKLRAAKATTSATSPS